MDSLLRIRPFEELDAEALCRLIQTALAQTAAGSESEAALRQMAVYYTPEEICASARDAEMLVATRGPDLLGAATLDGERVRNVFVRVDCQRQGVGKRLMGAIEASALRQGRRRLFLLANPTAVAFYQILGFRMVEERIESIGEHPLRLIAMQKALSPGSMS